MLRLVVLVALGACGRIGFDPGSLDAADGPRVVQHASNFVQSSMSVTITLPVPVTAGNLVLVLSSTSQPNTILPPVDSQGSTYTVIAEGAAFDPTTARSAAYAATIADDGALNVTCGDDANDNLHCHVYELHRVTQTLDANGYVAELNSTMLAVSTFMATRADSFLVGFFAANNIRGTFTPGPGYDNPETTDSASNDIAFSETAFATAAGIQSATATTTLNDEFGCLIVALVVE